MVEGLLLFDGLCLKTRSICVFFTLISVMPTVRIMGILQLYPFFDLNKNIKPKKKKLFQKQDGKSISSTVYYMKLMLHAVYTVLRASAPVSEENSLFGLTWSKRII